MGPRFRMGRRRGLLVGAAVGASVANSRAKSQAAEANMQAQQQQQPAAAPVESTTDQFAELEKLGQLRDQGILTDAEFDAKKKQILGI